MYHPWSIRKYRSCKKRIRNGWRKGTVARLWWLTRRTTPNSWMSKDCRHKRSLPRHHAWWGVDPREAHLFWDEYPVKAQMIHGIENTNDVDVVSIHSHNFRFDCFGYVCAMLQIRWRTQKCTPMSVGHPQSCTLYTTFSLFGTTNPSSEIHILVWEWEKVENLCSSIVFNIIPKKGGHVWLV